MPVCALGTGRDTGLDIDPMVQQLGMIYIPWVGVGGKGVED